MAMKAPAMMTRRLEATDAETVTRWWAGLTSAARASLKVHEGRAPAGVMAKLVEEVSDEDANVDFYEYLVNHEVYLVDAPPMHICTAHPAARAALAKGHVRASFECPRGERACPMRALLDAKPGRHVQFAIVK